MFEGPQYKGVRVTEHILGRRRLFLAALALAIFAVPTFAAAPAGSSGVAYVNGLWWTGNAFVAGRRVVRDGRFVAPSAQAEKIVDLAGGYVVPPFADAHNHMQGRPTDFSDRAIAAGIFYVMNPTLLASIAPAARQALAAPGRVDAIYSMGAITAPGGHPVGLYEDILRLYVYKDMKVEDFAGNAFHEVATASDIEPALDLLVRQHADFVKIVLMFSEEFAQRRDDPAFREKRGLDPALVPMIVQGAHRRGLRVAAHIESAADFRVIVAAGVDEAAHMPGYFAGIGPIARYVLTTADAQAAARAHIQVVTTAAYADQPTRDEADKLSRPSLPEIQAMQRDNLLKLKRAGVPLLIGTDGAADAAAGEARYLVSLGVLTPKEALITLSETTPRFIFPERRIGRLAPGFEASFLVLQKDPTQDIGAVLSIARRVKQGVELQSPQ
jgi:imidazolonepropionase-like amidohydrolase